LEETKKAEMIESAEKELPAPQGIGMAVAFDWGLATQVLLTPILSIFFGMSNTMKTPGSGPAPNNILFSIIALLIGIGLVLFGEQIRSGRKWARGIQIGANALLSLGGLLSLVRVYQGISVGNFWPVVTSVILLVFSPLIVWRMSRPATAVWFKNVPAVDARKRHGGKWVWFIALWAIVGGVLQTLAAMK
jgi:hypothetical protein